MVFDLEIFVHRVLKRSKPFFCISARRTMCLYLKNILSIRNSYLHRRIVPFFLNCKFANFKHFRCRNGYALAKPDLFGDLKEPQNKFTLLSFIVRKIGALYNNQKLTIED